MKGGGGGLMRMNESGREQRFLFKREHEPRPQSEHHSAVLLLCVVTPDVALKAKLEEFIIPATTARVLPALVL